MATVHFAAVTTALRAGWMAVRGPHGETDEIRNVKTQESKHLDYEMEPPG
jgi:hypothetical protein